MPFILSHFLPNLLNNSWNYTNTIIYSNSFKTPQYSKNRLGYASGFDQFSLIMRTLAFSAPKNANFGDFLYYGSTIHFESWNDVPDFFFSLILLLWHHLTSLHYSLVGILHSICYNLNSERFVAICKINRSVTIKGFFHMKTLQSFFIKARQRRWFGSAELFSQRSVSVQVGSGKGYRFGRNLPTSKSQETERKYNVSF